MTDAPKTPETENKTPVTEQVQKQPETIGPVAKAAPAAQPEIEKK